MARHPGLVLSNPKEPKFFLCAGTSPRRNGHAGPGDGHSAREWIWRRDRYEALFDNAPVGALKGESTPFYLYDLAAQARIARLVPEAKLIAVLRDPIDRAYSNWLHLWSDGLEPLSNFVLACWAEDERVAAGWAPFWHYLRLGRYGEQLTHLFSLFPRAQVHLLRYRELVDEPADTLNGIWRFLGVDTDIVGMAEPETLGHTSHLRGVRVCSAPPSGRALEKCRRLHASRGRLRPSAVTGNGDGMELGLNGRRAVVTGASKGIGLAVVKALVDEGVSVVAGARTTTTELDRLVQAGTVQAVHVDLASSTGPAALVDSALAAGPLDIVVNNVGAVTPRLDGFVGISDTEWMSTLTLTFLAAVRTTRAALPAMVAAGKGAIVTVCSVNAFLPDPAVIDYCAAKAALANFSKALSKEVGPHGIRVNTVSPGPVSTDLWLGDHGVAATVGGAQGVAADEIVQGQEHQAATGRFTSPAEVADLVVLLASDRTANVTGADFVVDGGLVTTL